MREEKKSCIVVSKATTAAFVTSASLTTLLRIPPLTVNERCSTDSGIAMASSSDKSSGAKKAPVNSTHDHQLTKIKYSTLGKA